MSWAAKEWAEEVWTSTREWSRDERNGLVGKSTDVHLSPGAKLVLMRLADRAKRGTHECWPARDRLAVECGIGESAVKSALKQLADAKLIERKPRYRNGRRTSDLYVLQIPQSWLSAWEESRGSESDQSWVDSNPEPTREPSDTSTSTPYPVVDNGSGSDSNPLTPKPSCSRCGAHLASDHAFDLYCSPCQRAVAEERIGVAA